MKHATILLRATILLMTVLLVAGVHAELVAVSHSGYHPDSAKQVVVYTLASSGTFDIRDSVYLFISSSVFMTYCTTPQTKYITPKASKTGMTELKISCI